ncbi:MAG: sulfotransferase family 2 domain-containing protein [Thalassococcus sp.]|uniref:sulfotransferase family 2 domain-containing protein n=1 Tax=Thalassococcus sp. TaxID=1928858 RepID=UPI001B13B196|nr:sulfotransferase family 2 domain-containing protein [Thalassococcus sp.]MBO6868000.1 sulfotransferase family 2 domain-containing protein [Thalassococcus sp.]
MPIFQANNKLHFFAHVPKCAGTTIEAHLIERFGPLGMFGHSQGFNVSLQHLTWAQVTSVVPENWIASSFAVVRHPLTRFVSAYNMRLSQARPPFPREVTITDFLDWVEARLPTNPELLDNHFRPQVEFLGPKTRVFRLEDGLDAVIADLDQKFGSSPSLPPLGHFDFHVSETEGLFYSSEILPKRLIERVRILYAEDHLRFGYNPEPARSVTVKILKPTHARAYKRQAWRIRRHLSENVLQRVRNIDV